MDTIFKSSRMEADRVHGGYEDDMVNFGYQKKDLANALQTEIARQEQDGNEAINTMASGADAAKAIIRLIAATHGTLAPREIVDKWAEVRGDTPAQRNDAMWDAFGDRTVECMARGSRYLAKIWVDAWNAGNGDHNIGEGAKQTKAKISNLYNDPSFVRSVAWNKYAGIP